MSVIKFNVAGKVTCPTFAHVDYVCDYLRRNLPSFSYQRIVKRDDVWNSYLTELNKQYGWHHLESPLIWIEYGISDDILEQMVEAGIEIPAPKAHYLGKASDFWEYCCEYYALHSVLSPSELKCLVQDNLKHLCDAEEVEKDTTLNANKRRICIVGANNDIIFYLARNLLELPEIDLREPTEILLFDNICTVDELNSLADYLDPGVSDEYAVSKTGKGVKERRVKVASIFDTTFLETCHILIVLNGTDKNSHEDIESWMLRNKLEMQDLAERLNAVGSYDIRIIFPVGLGCGPVCANANLLASLARTYRPKNIVVASASLGLNALPILAEAANVAITDVSLPPVWGSASSPKTGGGFVDCYQAIHHFTRFTPNERASRAKPNSTLPLGDYCRDERPIAYRIHNVPDLYRKILDYSVKNEQQVNFNTVKAVVDLLQLWYGIYDGEVISAGIVSNGTFGLPEGLMFSQPAFLENEDWLPCEEISLPNLDPGITVNDLATCSLWTHKTYMEEKVVEKKVETVKKILKAKNYCSLSYPGILKDD
ncbi:putative malate dehydrogenase 1B [Ctenocephalides felis]|uniref:putative malate dehydrogenase 1B n=1 Tax=Ctenocephalides felis TaxID=7515 RepID=UPI000E6E4EA6|nr:putative malate dehydrogenase 1B [Ctenocephalides felis]